MQTSHNSCADSDQMNRTTGMKAPLAEEKTTVPEQQWQKVRPEISLLGPTMMLNC